MPWIAAAAMVGSSLISGYGSNKAAKKTASAQRDAAQLQYQQSLPWSTTGLFGGATFDEGGRTAELALSPELKAEYERLYGRAGATAEEVAALAGDPFTAQKKLYEQQKSLFAPQQEKERLAMESRLLSQGRLGTTGGAGQFGEVIERQQMQDLARQVQSMDQAQGLIDTLRAREAGDISQALTLGELPLRYAELGRGIGSGLSSAAQYGGQLRSQAAAGLGGSQAAFWDQLGGKVGGMFNGGGGNAGAQFGASQLGGTLYGSSGGGSFAGTPNPAYWSSDYATQADFNAPF